MKTNRKQLNSTKVDDGWLDGRTDGRMNEYMGGMDE